MNSTSRRSLNSASGLGSMHSITSLHSHLSQRMSARSTQLLTGEFSSTGHDAEIEQMMLAITASWSPMRKYVLSITEQKWFSGGVFFVVIANTIFIAVQTDISIETNKGWYFTAVDQVFLGIYIYELSLKLYVWRRRFFHSGWNVFDFAIVMISIFQTLWVVLFGQLSGLNPKIFRLLRVFRAFRALRVLRSVSFVRSLQIIVDTLLSSLPAMGSIFLLLFLVMYIFAVVGVSLYKTVLPDRFGNIWHAMFTLYQLITLDDWFDLYHDGKAQAPTMILFLMAYIVFETFILVNLFVAVIVSNIEENQKKSVAALKRQRKKEREAYRLAHLEQKESTLQNSVVDGIGSEQPATDVKSSSAPIPTQPNNAAEIIATQDQHSAYYLMLLASLESNLERSRRLGAISGRLVNLTEGQAGHTAVAPPP